MKQAFKPSLVVDKVQESPRPKDKAFQKPKNNLAYENGTIVEGKQFKSPSITIPSGGGGASIRGSLSVATNVNYSGSFSSAHSPSGPSAANGLFT